MYYIRKQFDISASHQLDCDYETPCNRVHGHNFRFIVYCKRDTLNQNGMVIDFQEIKKLIHGKLDHQHINEILEFAPTAERLAKWACDLIPHCYKVEVIETEGNSAIYERD